MQLEGDRGWQLLWHPYYWPHESLNEDPPMLSNSKVSLSLLRLNSASSAPPDFEMETVLLRQGQDGHGGWDPYVGLSFGRG